MCHVFRRVTFLRKEESYPISDMDPKPIEFQILSILGEQVSLVPTKLSPGETAIVEFDKFYVPDGLSQEEKTVLKNTMTFLFSNVLKPIADSTDGSEFEEKERVAYPPCGEEEKALVLKSLLHRKGLLEQQLFDLGVAVNPEQLRKQLQKFRREGKISSSQPASVLGEWHLKHWHILNKFIDSYDSAQKCVKIEDVSFKDIELDLSDEAIRELLKQFVFFLLQGTNPIEEYKTKDPSAPAFIKRLERKPLGDKFPTYLDTYKSRKYPIPPTIAKVLEAVDLDPESMKNEIKRICDEERLNLLKKIEGIIPPSDPIWRIVGDTKDIVRIIDILRTKTLEYEDELRALLAQLEAADTKVRVCEQAREALLAEKARLEERIGALEEELNTTRTDIHDKDLLIESLRREKTEAETQLNRRIEDLTAQIAACEEEKARKQSEIDRLTNENTAQREELERLRGEITRLEEIQRTSERDIEQLRAEHAAALAVAEGARDAAVAAAERSATQLADKTTELATSQAALQAATEQLTGKDATIAELQRELRECENANARIREQLSEKTEEVTRLTAEVRAGEERIATITADLEEIQNGLQETTELTGGLRADLEEANNRIRELENELNAERTKVEDLTTQLRRCEEEKAALEASASGSARDTADLAGRLRVAEEERNTAQGTVAEQEANLKRLREQLGSAEERATNAEEETKRQAKVIDDKDETIAYFEKEIQDKQDELERAEQRAREAEEERAKLETRVGETIAAADQRVKNITTDLQNQFKDALDATKEEFEGRLKEEKSALETEQSKACAERIGDTQKEYEAALKAQKEEYEKALAVVQRIAGWIDSGSDAKISEEIVVNPETIHSSALSTIVSKLGEEPAPSSPALTGPQTAETVKAGTYLCYLVFFTAFLWQAYFPKQPVSPPSEPMELEKYNRQRFIETVFPAFFNGGSAPASEKWAESRIASKSTAYAFKSGLYQILYDKSGAYRKEFGGKLQTDMNAMTHYLHIFNKVARAMEDPAADGSILGLTPLDTVYLEEFIHQVQVFVKDYKSLYTKMDLEVNFAQFMKDMLIINQPSIQDKVLERYLVKTPAGLRIVTKPGSASQINYAVVFYCFLVVMRDYLNHIQRTVKNVQCPLPPFLVTQKPKK